MAREALSARLDGEREPAPSARVDEHVAGCVGCRMWRDEVTGQAVRLKRLAADSPMPSLSALSTRSRSMGWGWARWALLAVGAVQLGLAGVQGFGLDMGLNHGGMTMGGHLLNESTAWSVALGAIMVTGALRPSAAEGLTGVLGVFVIALTVFVIVDAQHGAVTPVRILTHIPAVLGALLALLVWRRWSKPAPDPTRATVGGESIALPRNASRGRRRDHLWSTDGAA